jgi:3-methylcrotonyl-CoA carboxylase beta subunit
MVEGTSFMGLGGPNLVKGAVGQVVDAKSLGGPRMHTTASGVAHYRAKDDAACLQLIRERFRALPPAPAALEGSPPAKAAEGLYDLMPADHRLPYNIEDALERIFDRDDYLEFQPNHAPELLCADAKLFGRPVAVVANRRGFLKTESGPRIGGIVYAESARKVAYFVENAERNGVPLVYLQDESETLPTLLLIRPRGAPRASYRRAEKRRRQTPVRRPGFASCLPEAEAQDRFWRARSISLRPILHRAGSWIRKLRP